MSTVADGQAAEQAVAELLAQTGYTLIEQNWRTKFAEIDLVMRSRDGIAFIEVKYRSNLSAGDGFDYITADKQRRMERAAEGWMLVHQSQLDYRLMVAAVTGQIGSFNIDVRDL